MGSLTTARVLLLPLRCSDLLPVWLGGKGPDFAGHPGWGLQADVLGQGKQAGMSVCVVSNSRAALVSGPVFFLLSVCAPESSVFLFPLQNCWLPGRGKQEGDLMNKQTNPQPHYKLGAAALLLLVLLGAGRQLHPAALLHGCWTIMCIPQ